MKPSLSATTLSIFLAASASLADAPSWTKGNTVTHLSKNLIVATCEGTGPAKDLAYGAAIQNCNNIAANELTSEFTSRNVIVESEDDSPKLFSEISSEKKVTNLHPETQLEQTDSNGEGFTTYLRVQYDLNLAKVAFPLKETAKETKGNEAALEVQENAAAPSGLTRKRTISSAEQSFVIQMLPETCRDALIRGKRPRSQVCQNNPLNIKVNTAEDDEIILRPRSKFLMPKTIKVHQSAVPSEEAQVLEVEFERK